MNTTLTEIKLPKMLLPFAMLYLTIMLICAVTAHKTVEIHGYTTAAAALVIPFWFILSDIIAEIYGFKIARQLLWLGLLFQGIFAIACLFLIHLHSPSSWSYQADYELVLGGLLRLTLSIFIAVIIAGYLNIRLLTKWKFLLKGKYFWLRSIGASGIGETIYSIIASVLIFYGTMNLHALIIFTILALLCKIIYTIIFAYPATLLTYWLQKLEGFEISDYSQMNPLRH